MEPAEPLMAEFDHSGGTQVRAAGHTLVSSHFPSILCSLLRFASVRPLIIRACDRRPKDLLP